jgi:hypothetical protein
VAGAAYLVAQVSFTAAVRPGSAAEPLQRIAAILMGPDVAPPPVEFTFTVLGMALIIHFALSIVFGRVVSVLACADRPARSRDGAAPSDGAGRGATGDRRGRCRAARASRAAHAVRF